MKLKEQLHCFPRLSKLAYHFLHERIAYNQRKANKDMLIQWHSLKNSAKSNRCFIVGTGPSLKIEDLEALQDEVVFAPNRIFELFEHTAWRPTYYINQDHVLIQNFSDKIKEIPAELLFLPMDFRSVFTAENYRFFVLRHREFYPKDAPFSRNLSRYLAQGFTVIYGAIQIAAYMGFKEIYLLGVDHNYNISRDANGNIKRNDNVAVNYAKGMTDFTLNGNLPRIEETTLAFETAEKLSKKLGIKIYNCTRGGKLEAFERKSLNDVLADNN